jgi:acylphosphatase
MLARVAKRLRITGLVQGVGYRATLAHEAGKLDLRGWVRNRFDGSVEALVIGEPTTVGRLIDWAHRGPVSARVDRVEVSEADLDVADAAVEGARFQIRQTA